MQRAREHLQRVLERAHVEAQQARHEQDRRARRVLDELVAREPEPARQSRWRAGRAARRPRPRAARIEQRERHGRPSRSAAQPARDPAALGRRAPPARRPPRRRPPGTAVIPEAITCAVTGLSDRRDPLVDLERDVGHQRARRRRRDLAQVGEHRADLDAVALGVARASRRPSARRSRARRPAPSPAARRRWRPRPSRSRGPRARRPARARAAARGSRAWSGARPSRTRPAPAR